MLGSSCVATACPYMQAVDCTKRLSMPLHMLRMLASMRPLWPLGSRDWWALGIATVAIFVAAGGGIGGGGVLVPLFASVLGRPQHLKSCLSSCGQVLSSCMNIQLLQLLHLQSCIRCMLKTWTLVTLPLDRFSCQASCGTVQLYHCGRSVGKPVFQHWQKALLQRQAPDRLGSHTCDGAFNNSRRSHWWLPQQGMSPLAQTCWLLHVQQIWPLLVRVSAHICICRCLHVMTFNSTQWSPLNRYL